VEIPDSGSEDEATEKDTWLNLTIVDPDVVADIDSVMLLLPVTNDVSMEGMENVFSCDVA
jgi:hypothetical protein